MIVGFADRSGVHGPHQSNVISKSSKHGGQDIDAISGRMRRSTSCIGRVCLATPPDPPTRQGTAKGPPCKGSLLHDLPAKSMHETIDKKLDDVEGRSRQEAKINEMFSRSLASTKLEEVDGRSRQEAMWMHHESCLDQMIVDFPQKRSTWHAGARYSGEQVIVEFPMSERRKSAPTGTPEERGDARKIPFTEMRFERTKGLSSLDRKAHTDRGNPIKEMLSKSLTSIDLKKPRTNRGNPMKEMLSRSLTSLDRKPYTDATSCPEKHSEHQKSMQDPSDSTRQDHQGKCTHQSDKALDSSKETIDWGGEHYYWKYELNFYSDQKDPTFTCQ